MLNLEWQLKLCEDVLWYYYNGPSEKFLEAIQNLDKEAKRIREIFDTIEEYSPNEVIPEDMMLYVGGSKFHLDVSAEQMYLGN